MNKLDLWILYKTFFKIGLFTFGGGYAMLPIIQREIVDNLKWATEEEVLDFYAIGQSTPGIIAINTATFIGYKKAKAIGGIVATLGMVTPSLIIITIIAAFLSEFRENIYVQKALVGIRGCVVALIAIAIIRMAKKAIISPFAMILAIVGFVLLLILKISPVLIVLSGIVLGIILTYFKRRKSHDSTS